MPLSRTKHLAYSFLEDPNINLIQMMQKMKAMNLTKEECYEVLELHRKLNNELSARQTSQVTGKHEIKQNKNEVNERFNMFFKTLL